ncbi:MAG: hypothetical protein K0Q68_152 [Moraxellaceae bacterium]|jgi:hypothetical protein|nr:hypothetical protein [Moraxellaceae bacterium]
MDFKAFALIMSMIFMTSGLLLAARLMSISLTFWQALIASVLMSIISGFFAPNSQAGFSTIIAAFLVSIIPLKLLTRESMWSTIKLSIFGTIIGGALLLLLAKVFFPVTLPITRM